MPETPASPSMRRAAPSRRTWLIVAAAFAVGVLLFLWLWADRGGGDDFYRADVPATGPEGQVFEPLPVPMPGEDAGTPPTPREGQPAPGMVGMDESRPSPAMTPPVAPTGDAPSVPAAGSSADSDPVILGKASAPYPVAALRKGEEGTVMLRVSVGPDGMPAGIAMARGSGSRALDRAAMGAVRQWRFRPAMRDGQPVAATVQIPVSYKLGER